MLQISNVLMARHNQITFFFIFFHTFLSRKHCPESEDVLQISNVLMARHNRVTLFIFTRSMPVRRHGIPKIVKAIKRYEKNDIFN